MPKEGSVTSADAPSRQVLDALPGRALKLLSTLSKSTVIHAALAQRGYTKADHEEGWDLLLQVSGFKGAKGGEAEQEDPDVQKAIVELDQWDEPNFRLIRATLLRRHPEQAAFVFENLEPATGSAAVLSVSTLLDRLDALESSPDRKASRKADHAALELLSARGITKEERSRLRGLVKTALRPAHEPSPAPKATASEEEQREALLKLKSWYDEWSEVARVVITRRDHLIRLGLAKRKAGRKKAGKSKGSSSGAPEEG